MDGTSEREGRLQVCLGGLWGTVCDGDNSWGPQQAAVVCQQLDFSGDGENHIIFIYSNFTQLYTYTVIEHQFTLLFYVDTVMHA